MSGQNKETSRTGLEIAVIGMAGRFPGAGHTGEFWDNLIRGKESICFFSDQELEKAGVRPDVMAQPNYVRAKAILRDIAYFDASFFGYFPREAKIMDPQMRIMHECVWEALEDAGYNIGTYPGLIGLYAGAASNRYWENLALLDKIGSPAEQYAAGQYVDKDFLCTQVSYKLDLKGPAVAVKSACSTALVAIHLACRALLLGECDIALAGGVSVDLPQTAGYLYQDGMILAKDGHCRAFDANATGTVPGEGAGIAALKPLRHALRDRDHVYAVIKSSAINNDGSRKVGYNAPSVEGQNEVICSALRMAKVEAGTIGYLEAHGTGTVLGDPVEIEALKLAWSSDKKAACRIGSVKSNIGHLNSAAGAAGFIKTVLALENKTLPPSIHWQTPNPQIDFANSPFSVNHQLTPWQNDSAPLRAAVSSFGTGGTNAHVILEEAPRVEESSPGRPWKLLLLSAKSEASLDRMTKNLAGYLRRNPGANLDDVAYTLQVGRKSFPYRKFTVCADARDAAASLSDPEAPGVHAGQPGKGERFLVFLFPGQNSQYVNMGLELYRREPLFRAELDNGFAILEPLLGVNVKDLLYPALTGEETRTMIHRTDIGQPLIFLFEYSLARLMMKWGLKPQAFIGHSIGEYTAACLAGVFSLEEALRLVVRRGKLMQEIPGGAMLSAAIPEDELKPMVNGNLEIAAVNSPRSCVISGPAEEIESFLVELKQKGVTCSKLFAPQAFHSKMLEPILDKFRDQVKQIRLNPPAIPFISNITGEWIKAEEAVSPEYWTRQLREKVRFSRGAGALMEKHEPVFLEVGPGRILSAFVRHNPAWTSGCLAFNLIRHPNEKIPDELYLSSQIGWLWLSGIDIDWSGFYSKEKRNRVPLPTYCFDKQHYWIEGNPEKILAAVLQAGQKPGIPDLPGTGPSNPGPSNHEPLGRKENMADWFYLPTWKRSAGKNSGGPRQKTGKILLLLNEDGFGHKLADYLQEKKQDVLVVKAGRFSVPAENGDYTLEPGNEEDYYRLFRDLKQGGEIPRTILDLWNVSETPAPDDITLEHLEETLTQGFYHFLYLVKALEKQELTDRNIRLFALVNHLQEIGGHEGLCPGKAVMMGPCGVIPHEIAGMECRTIDIPYPVEKEWQEKKLLDELFLEITGVYPHDRVVAYRGSYRWTRAIEPIPLEQVAHPLPQLKPHGVYLITGGLGAIGFMVARYIAQEKKGHGKNGVRLVLVGRSVPPPEPRWSHWLETHDTDDPTSTKIRRVKELKALGADVLVIRAEVSDPGQMQEAVATVKQRFARIDGVIHSAGVADGGLIKLRPKELSENVFAAKIRGTLVLDQLLRKENLDFFLLFSSLASMMPAAGNVAYCAANAFLDAFAHYKRLKHGVTAVSIDWDGVKEIGMTVEWAKQFAQRLNLPDYHQLLEHDKEVLEPGEVPEVFARILGAGFPQVLISTTDLYRRLEANTGSELKFVSFPSPEAPLKENPSGVSRQELERKFIEVWKDFFGVEDIAVRDNFFELGATSLDLIQVNSRLTKQLDIDIPVNALFTYPTIASSLRHLFPLDPPLDAPPGELLPPDHADRPKGPPAPTEPQEVETPGKPGNTQSRLRSLRIERRSLSNLISCGKIGPLDSAALSYLTPADLEYLNLGKDDILHHHMDNLPLLTEIKDSSSGRIGIILLPLFQSQLYTQREKLLDAIHNARVLAGSMGARHVSLTGLTASATDYGRLIPAAPGGNHRLPKITTGHATTIATVVMSIKKVLEIAKRDLRNESPGFLGLGSIGTGTLLLMLKCLPHPDEIILCDIKQKIPFMEKLKRALRERFAYQGKTRILESGLRAPARFYDAGLIVGATNVPGILDIDRVNKGTLIIDDSAPKCFNKKKALERFYKEEDILFTEGGVIRSPYPFSRTVYLPGNITVGGDRDMAGYDEYNIGSCVFSSLLPTIDDSIGITVGEVDLADSYTNYRVLVKKGFQAADLHCEEVILDKEIIRKWSRKNIIGYRIEE